MIYNTIMVQLDIDEPAAPRLQFAWALARRFEADLIAFAAADAPVVLPGSDGISVAGGVLGARIEEIEARLQALRGEFESLMGDDVRVSWRGFAANPTQTLAVEARVADLIVTGSPAIGPFADHARRIDAGGLVLAAGRPVLFASRDLAPVMARNVLVAWKDTREARRAVVDALPFLTAAAEVLVAAVEEEAGGAARSGVADVVRFLMKHGVTARSEVVRKGEAETADTLVKLAADAGSDLLVAGAYGHSRLREWAFGGVTRTLLQKSQLNRLLSC